MIARGYRYDAKKLKLRIRKFILLLFSLSWNGFVILFNNVKIQKSILCQIFIILIPKTLETWSQIGRMETQAEESFHSRRHKQIVRENIFGSMFL